VQVDDDPHDHAEEALIGPAVRGSLNADDLVRLKRHLEGCPTCAAVFEATRIFHASVAPGRDDDMRDEYGQSLPDKAESVGVVPG